MKPTSSVMTKARQDVRRIAPRELKLPKEQAIMKKVFSIIGIALALILMLFSVQALSHAQTAPSIPQSKHVWLITEENHSYENAVPAMPYLMSLGNKYGIAQQSYADMHNSLSALMHLVSGQTVTTNDGTTLTFSNDNLVRHMLPAGLTFRSYQESLPFAGYSGISSGLYVKRHNPLIYFTDVANSSTLKLDSVPYTQLAADLVAGATGRFNYVTPNLADDAHNGTMQAADTWLSTHLPAILARPEFQAGGDGLMIVTFDEGNLGSTPDFRCNATTSSSTGDGCGGRVMTVLIGPNVKPGTKSNVFHNHESVLKTIIEALGISDGGFPGPNTATAADFSEFFSASTTAPTRSVVISSPVAGSTVTSPVTVTAKANDTLAVTYMKIWLDGTQVFLKTGVNSISTALTTGIGSHRVSVEAGDATGSFKTTELFTVAAPPPPPPPTPIATYTNLDDQTFLTCGSCGDNGGGGALATFTQTPGIVAPSEDGAASRFSISGPAFSNGFWYLRKAAVANSASFTYSFDMYIPTGSTPQAIEFQVQQGQNGNIYNMAWQDDYSHKQWRVYNYTTKAWEGTTIPWTALSGNTWHRIISTFHTDLTGLRVYHDTLSIDGVVHQVGISHAAFSKPTTSNTVNPAFQLDLNGSGSKYSVFIDNMSLNVQ